MKNLLQVFLGIILALASIGLLLGGFLLSLAEGKTSTATPTPTNTLIATSSPTWLPFTAVPNSPTPPPTWTLTWTSTETSTWTLTWTPTLPSSPTNCPPPVGWLPYFVQANNSLDTIATRYQISSAELQQANCLLTTELSSGMVILVPPIHTQSWVRCGPPNNWIIYIVQPGDTLYRLSLRFRVTVAELRRANCLSSTFLRTGQNLYIPPWFTRWHWSLVPDMALPFSTLTYMPVSILPANTPTAPTELLTGMPTDTLVPAAPDTPSELPTETPLPTIQ